MSEEKIKKPGLMSRRMILGTTIGGAVVFFIAGIIFWGGFNTGMEATNTMEFCISCHEMEKNVYEEYTPTIHYSNRTGVRATCPDCHVPRPWVHKMVRKIQASNEVYHKILGTVDTPEKFNEHRLTMAKRVWKAMKETDSRECRNCHNFESMNPEFQRPRARKQHMNAFETGQTCIDCHKGIAHKQVRDLLTDEELETLEAPNPKYVREIPQLFLDGLARVEAKEAKQAEEEEQAKEKARQAKLAARDAEKARVEKAVADALAAYKAELAGAAVATTASNEVETVGFGVDWSAAPAREITLFYPGETSMEWVLTGKDHGGARPLVKGGDRCVTCHDKETAAMGEKLVTGQKAETKPLPDKRASIPVTVQAAHDDENLYMRFEWEATEHVPVPFVDGGKMDPENPMKLAIMLSTDDVEFADRSGCWQSCHHDARTMPHAPDSAATSEAAQRLEFSQGVTKYLKESRTKVEVKGRRGKKRGGWDKLKSPEEIQAALDGGLFMDLIRYKSGTGETEDGYILDQRYMTGGQGFEIDAREEAGRWVVVIKRPLNSGKPGDLPIEPGNLYNFGFAIHDDFTDARFHHVSLGYRLGLDQSEAEINAVKQEVAEAPAAAPAVAMASKTATGNSTIDVDWSKAGSREISLLYPGETSMEWVLTGKDHGGARPLVKGGDRCVTCHDKEIDAMGSKIVSGEKAETSPIPGKRPSIPVNVESTHDGEFIYMRFTWPEGEHTPAPFVDGGKMDPDNPMKLAIMFSTDDIEYADRSGCWQTCHHDARTMPHAPDADAMAASEVAKRIDLTAGVTKYLQESRSKVEVKGRRGKKRGGWDKLKTAEELEAELKAGKYMDLLRYKSGDGATEDGYILDQRYMSGGQGFTVSARNEAGEWVVSIKRKLKSDQPGDVSLEPGKIYNFGFAIHDDYSDARFHHVSLGYRLALDNESDAVELNVAAQ